MIFYPKLFLSTGRYVLKMSNREESTIVIVIKVNESSSEGTDGSSHSFSTDVTWSSLSFPSCFHIKWLIFNFAFFPNFFEKNGQSIWKWSQCRRTKKQKTSWYYFPSLNLSSSTYFVSDTAFKQQRLPAWQPIITANTALPVFLIIGLIFIPIGVVLVITSERVWKKDSFFSLNSLIFLRQGLRVRYWLYR